MSQRWAFPECVDTPDVNDPRDAAEVPRRAALGEDDARDIVGSRVFSAIAPGTHSGGPIIAAARAGQDRQ